MPNLGQMAVFQDATPKYYFSVLLMFWFFFFLKMALNDHMLTFVGLDHSEFGPEKLGKGLVTQAQRR